MKMEIKQELKNFKKRIKKLKNKKLKKLKLK